MFMNMLATTYLTCGMPDRKSIFQYIFSLVDVSYGYFMFKQDIIKKHNLNIVKTDGVTLFHVSQCHHDIIVFV